MPKAISNTSPLLYLYRIGGIEWLSQVFKEVWVPDTVRNELQAGKTKGYDVPNPEKFPWIRVVNPKYTPSDWLVLDLVSGEIAAMALALENSEMVVLLDDMLARRTAQAAGLQVCGTLKILLMVKSYGIIDKVEPFLLKLSDSGMWISDGIKNRVLKLADET